MNRERRKRINKVKVILMDEALLENALNELEDILMDEEDSYGCIPENLQSSRRAEESEEAIDILNDAVDMINEYLDENKKEDNYDIGNEIIDLLDMIC